MNRDLPPFRIRGVIYGTAVADAIGAANEFLSPGDIAKRGPITGMVPSSIWQRGEWTDDTELTLAVCEAYDGPSLAVQRTVAAMLHWYATGPKDIGNTTAAALDSYLGLDYQTPPAVLPTNGSIMRAAPTGCIYQPDDPALVYDASILSNITHTHPYCRGACIAQAVAVSNLVYRPFLGPLAAMQAAAAAVQDCYKPVAETIFGVLHRDRPQHENASMGFVLLTLERAFTALRDAANYQDAVLHIANLGGDADTNAAVAGALLGAWFGENAIPAEWHRDVLHQDRLERACQILLRHAEVQ